ncbi:competence protein CoiA [Bacillus velezensis]|uniref:competence protein CoiA n=1 Tax=Bacillus velezensis TaxID=492670 RepID=UPI001EEC4E86|nr:competence protein CoiA family protein [Bacillus velezensis]
MLTAKVGENIIMSFDNKYDRYTLKKWSDKKILKCPVCNDTYEYCHGDIVSPYFRHKNKKCSDFYSEPETDEHRKGKIMLFNWISQQPDIDKCELEKWLPETKQRPDIYFEKNGKKYVIEFQCSPIASEFLNRKELYKLNNITDIWILGIGKYNLTKHYEGYNHSSRFRTIEKECSSSFGLYYLDTESEAFLIGDSVLHDNNLEVNPFTFFVTKFIKKYYLKPNIQGDLLNHLSCFDDHIHYYMPVKTKDVEFNDSICLTFDFKSKYKEIIDEVIESYSKYSSHLEFLKQLKELKKSISIRKIKKVVKLLNDKYCNFNLSFEISGFNSQYYICSINFEDCVFFIKKEQIDFCSKHYYCYPTYRKRKTVWREGYRHKNLNSLKIKSVFDNSVSKFIERCVEPFILERIENELRFQKNMNIVKDSNLKIITNDYWINGNERFKYYRNIEEIDEEFIKNELVEDTVKFKKSKNIIYMFNESNDINKIINTLKEIGFNNVEMLSNCTKKRGSNR